MLYNEKGEPLKDYTHNNFTTTFWRDFTNETFISDLNSKFSNKDFYDYVDKNFDTIYMNLIKKIEIFKSENIVTISYNENNLVNTVKKMIINRKLDFSYAFSFVDMNKLREEMENLAIDLSFYDEFDKLEDDLEYCLNKFFKYNDKELYDLLINKENFTLMDGNKLVKVI